MREVVEKLMVTAVIEKPVIKKKNGYTPCHRYSEEELAVIRRDYKGTNASAQQIADRMGLSKWGIKGQCAKMGLLRQKSPPWTEQEIEILSSLIHTKTVHQIAKRLYRSQNAVKIKATRLKMGLRVRDGWYTKREVSEILGVDHKKVQAWIDNGALVARWHTERKPSKLGNAMWHVTEKALRDFIISHTEELMGRNLDIQQIVWILIGDETVCSPKLPPT